MEYQSLDGIVCSCLAQKQLSMHKYLQFLKLGTDCFRELHYDILQVVNVRKMDVTDYKAIVLPEDFIDVVSLSVRVGDRLRPLTQAKLHTLYNFSDNGDPIPWDSGDTGITDTPGAIASPYEVHFNAYNEFLGRLFAGVKNEGDYILIPGRGEIQLRSSFDGTEVILEYLGSINYADAATMVDPYAQACIEQYIFWKSNKQAAENRMSPEANNFFQAFKQLARRKNPLTTEDIKKAIRNGNKSVIKN